MIQTVGCFEEGDCVGSAFIMGLWGDDGHGCRCEPFLAYGTLLDATTDVFAAEAIALHDKAAMVQEIFKRIKSTRCLAMLA